MSMNETKDGPIPAPIPDRETEEPDPPVPGRIPDPPAPEGPDPAESPEDPEIPDESEDPKKSEAQDESEDPDESEGPEDPEERAAGTRRFLAAAYDVSEVLGIMTAVIMLVFAFAVRLNVVEGGSMRPTLEGGDTLVVTDFYTKPVRGDIVILHRIDAAPYDKPIVKRVIAVGGQTVDIDFSAWILTVDGERVSEDYRWLNPERELLKSEIPLPVTLGENEIFVMGDNRNASADSRQSEIGPVDTRCVVGRAVARFSPGGTCAAIRNPFESENDRGE